MRDVFQQIILKKLWEMKENYAQKVMAMPDQLRRSQRKFAEVRKGELIGQRWEEDWAASPKRECMWENHRTYTEREKWERRNWRAGSWWVFAWVGLWLCLASFIHPREPPNDTSMKTQNSVIHSLLVLHGRGREKEQRRWLKRKSKEHFTSSMEAKIKKKKKKITWHFPKEVWFTWHPEGLIRSQIGPFRYSQYFPFLRHVTSQLSLIKTFTYDPIFLPNIRKLRHRFSAGQCEHLSNLPLV